MYLYKQMFFHNQNNIHLAFPLVPSYLYSRASHFTSWIDDKKSELQQSSRHDSSHNPHFMTHSKIKEMFSYVSIII